MFYKTNNLKELHCSRFFAASLVLALTVCPRYVLAQDKNLAVVTTVLDQYEQKKKLALFGTIDRLEATNKDIREVLQQISEKTGVTILSDPDITGTVTVYLTDVGVEDALRIILDADNLAFSVTAENTVRVMQPQTYKNLYGHAFGQDVQTKAVKLSFANIADVTGVLEQMKSEQGKIVPNVEDNSVVLTDSPQSLAALVQYIQNVDIQVVTKVFPLNFASVDEVVEGIKGTLTAGVGKMDIKRPENSVTVTDTAEKISAIEQVIKDLDQKKKEVIVESRVIEIHLNEEHLEGVDWEAIVSNYKKLIINENEQVGVGNLTPEDFQVLMEALDTVGSVETIFENKTSTSFEMEAELVHEVKDLKFIITPKVDDDDMLNVKLKIKPSEKIVYKSADLNMENGSTIVVGGLIDEVFTEAIRKIPLLGDLPFLGVAFRTQRQKENKVETVVLITVKLNDEVQ